MWTLYVVYFNKPHQEIWHLFQSVMWLCAPYSQCILINYHASPHHWRLLKPVHHEFLQTHEAQKNDILTLQGATINFTVLSEYVISLSVQVCPLPAEPLIGGWFTDTDIYWFTYCSGHSISSINTPASHEGDTATKILNSLLLILSRTQKKLLI